MYIEKALEQIDPKNQSYADFARNYAATPGADFIKSKKLLSAVRSESVGEIVTLGFLYLNNGLLDSADIEIQKAYSRYNAAPENYSINTLNNLRLLDGCVNYSYHKPVNFSEGVTTNDSISEMMNLEQRLSNENLETSTRMQKEMLESRLANQRIWIWLLAIVFISLLIIFAVYYIWHRKYRILRQQLGHERVTQIILETADNPLDEDVLHAIISKRIRLCVESFRNSGYYSRLQKVSADKHDDGFLPLKQRAEIQEKMLECFSDFVIDLKNDGVKLNLDDISFCLFSLLAIDNKTISKCTGSSEGALRTRKSRLKSKLSSFMFRTIFHEPTD